MLNRKKKSFAKYLHLTIDLYDTDFASRAYQPKDRIATITVVVVLVVVAATVAMMVSTALNKIPERNSMRLHNEMLLANDSVIHCALSERHIRCSVRTHEIEMFDKRLCSRLLAICSSVNCSCVRFV